MTHVERESSSILVVDDDRATRLLMRHKLEQDGYVVEEAADGGSAVAMYQRTSPDVVLMDASMPAVDGFAPMCSMVSPASDRPVCTSRPSGRPTVHSEVATPIYEVCSSPMV